MTKSDKLDALANRNYDAGDYAKAADCWRQAEAARDAARARDLRRILARRA